jgi:dienelactone hydrolase
MFRRSLAFAVSLLLCAGMTAAADEPEVVQLDSVLPTNPDPIKLQGALRRPEGSGPFGAVVLLPSCNGDWLRADERRGKMLVAWGYVALSVDSFGPRGITTRCTTRLPADMAYDAYRALRFLVRQPYVDRSRIAVWGFSSGGRLTLLSVEQGPIERVYHDKFRAAVAFYPPCSEFSGRMTVPTLVLIGGRDDWARADACRDMAAGRSVPGTSRNNDHTGNVRLVVYPDAHHAFDVALPGRSISGHWLEYNKAAADQATQDVRQFLDTLIGRP